jgi:hypothetical protein
MIPFTAKQTAVQLRSVDSPDSPPQTRPNLLAITQTCRQIHAETSLLVSSLNVFDAMGDFLTFTEVARWSLSATQRDAITTIRIDISTAYEMVRRDSENWLGFIENTKMYPVTNSEFRYALRLCRGLRRVVLVVEEGADVWCKRRGADLWCSQSVDEEYAKDEGDEEEFGRRAVEWLDGKFARFKVEFVVEIRRDGKDKVSSGAGGSAKKYGLDVVCDKENRSRSSMVVDHHSFLHKVGLYLRSILTRFAALIS